jgi:putative hydrolase of the HAD superfamily
MPRETILIDADDTLWEDNVFFEQTIEEFLTLLEPFGYQREYARHILNETERRNIRQHGYGVRSFGRSVEETYLKLAGQLAEPATVEALHIRVGELERMPPNVLDGVIETLDYLAGRHRLILFTKGESAEQAAKVERSGLQIHFDVIEIMPEKDVATYRALVNRHHVVKSHGWMVGNSPRHDINPALEAGLNAVFIPHAATWDLEHEEVRSGAGRLLILSSFRNLRDHF